MNRIGYGYSESISYAFSLLPNAIRNRLQYTHFLTGVDPIWVGLHNYIDTGDGRSYHNTAHVSYPWNAINKHGQTTVVLPLLKDAHPYVIIHELGHCLDEILEFRHNALPVNEYAKTNRLEAFAEAFACQYFWLVDKAEQIFLSDKATQYLFSQLALV